MVTLIYLKLYYFPWKQKAISPPTVSAELQRELQSSKTPSIGRKMFAISKFYISKKLCFSFEEVSTHLPSQFLIK